jgi:hypothetical protein
MKCDRPCNLNISVISRLRSIYGGRIVDTCVTSCRCDKHEYVHPDDKVCQVLASLAMTRSEDDCRCGQGARARDDNLTEWKIEKLGRFAKRDPINYLIKREARANVENHLRVRTVETTVNPRENWCKHKCAAGLGFGASYCDVLT